MKQNKLKITIITLAIISLFGLVFAADSNGIWHQAEDILGGVFGADEDVDKYVFQDPVEFNDEITVTTIKSNSATGNVVIQLG